MGQSPDIQNQFGLVQLPEVLPDMSPSSHSPPLRVHHPQPALLVQSTQVVELEQLDADAATTKKIPAVR
jgi:hypothetical protein